MDCLKDTVTWDNWMSNFKVINVGHQGQIKLKSQILYKFRLVRMITCHPFKLESPNLDHECILVQLRSLLILGLTNPEIQFTFVIEKAISSYLFALFLYHI